MIEGVQYRPEGPPSDGSSDAAKVPNPPMPSDHSPSSSSSSTSSFTFVADPFLVLDNDLDDVSEVIKQNIMTDQSSGASTPSNSRSIKCADSETVTDKRWTQTELNSPQQNSFDSCKEREIGQIVSLLQQADPPSLGEPTPQFHQQNDQFTRNNHLEYAAVSGREVIVHAQGMFTGQRDPLIGGGGGNGMSPIVEQEEQRKSHHQQQLAGAQFCEVGIELEQYPQQQQQIFVHPHNTHYSHNDLALAAISHSLENTAHIQHFVTHGNGTAIILENGILMESPPPLVLEQQQQSIKAEMLLTTSDNAFGQGYQRSVQVGGIVDHLQSERFEPSADLVKDELIKLLLEMSPEELERLRAERAHEYHHHQQHHQLVYCSQQHEPSQQQHEQHEHDQHPHPLIQLQNIPPAQRHHEQQHRHGLLNGADPSLLLVHSSPASTNSFCPSVAIHSPAMSSPNAFQSVGPSEYFGEEDSTMEEICWAEEEATTMGNDRGKHEAMGEEGKLVRGTHRQSGATTAQAGRRKGHKTERRTAHNLIEKKYRCSINDRINQLKEMLSNEEGITKLSKSATLRRAVDHIFTLRAKNAELGRENARLRKTLQVTGLAMSEERQTVAAPTALIKQEVRMGEVRTTGHGTACWPNKAPRGRVASTRRSNIVGSEGSGQAKDQSRVTLCVFMFLLLAFNPLSALFFTNELPASGNDPYAQQHNTNIGTSAEPVHFAHHRTLLGDDRFSAAFAEGAPPVPSSSIAPSSLPSALSSFRLWPIRPFLRHSLVWLFNSLFVFLILTRLLVSGEPVADRRSPRWRSFVDSRLRAETAIASGNYKEAQRELGESLKILQRPLPSTGSVDEWMSLTFSIIRHFLNGLWIGRWFARRRRPSVPHQSVCRSHAATALVYHQLHQLHLLDVGGIRLTSRGALNLALLATNLAESAGSPAISHSFRAEIYLCAALRSILCLPKCLRRVVAAYFFRRAKRHLRKSAALEGCPVPDPVLWLFHPLARHFLSCPRRVGTILSQSGAQKTPNFPFSASTQPPKPLEVLKEAFKMHLLGQLLCRLESADGRTLRLADFVEQSQLLLNICEGRRNGAAESAESAAEEPKSGAEADVKTDGEEHVPCASPDNDLLRPPLLSAEGDELCAWWTYLLTGGLHWRHGDAARAQRNYSLVRKLPPELAQNDLALAVGLAFCTRKMCFEDREKDKFPEVVIWHVRRANAHLKRDDWPTMGRDRAGTLEGMLPRGKASDGSVSLLKQKCRILCCQWLLCSLLDVWSFRFAHCGLIAPLEIRRLYAEVMDRIGREGEAPKEERMVMFRELSKALCGLHQIGSQLNALRESNAQQDEDNDGGQTKSNGQGETVGEERKV